MSEEIEMKIGVFDKIESVLPYYLKDVPREMATCPSHFEVFEYLTAYIPISDEIIVEAAEDGNISFKGTEEKKRKYFNKELKKLGGTDTAVRRLDRISCKLKQLLPTDELYYEIRDGMVSANMAKAFEIILNLGEENDE